jgi:hypothetical protein
VVCSSIKLPQNLSRTENKILRRQLELPSRAEIGWFREKNRVQMFS